MKTKLGTITKSIFDGKHGDCKGQEGSGLFFISVKDLTEYDIDYSNAREITKEDFTTNYLRTNLENGDTLYANTGDTIGKSVFVKNNPLVKQTSFQKSVAVIKPNTDFVDSRYLYYLLKYITPLLKKASSGSAQKNLLLSTMRDFDIDIHERNEQIRITSVLGAIDDKVRCNLTFCTELESMAKLLYDYWFTQFDFPNEEGKPYRSSGGVMEWNEQLKREIPKGWDVTTMASLAPALTGKEDANFSTSNGNYKFFTCAQETMRCDTPAFSGHAVLIAGNGDFNVKHFTGSFNAYQRTYVLMPKEAKHYAVMYIAAQKRIQAFKQGANGSIVKFITKGDVENIPIILPDNDSLLNTLNQILEKIEHCERENDELKKLRDWLLPMLMSGQATVE